ncbi:organic solute transporter Ostalpha-domain-containing protein [Chytridium lagenaria]|nr:organic solute transporter Ostalpha-domain-containing protein [Chytridium lagenaria]
MHGFGMWDIVLFHVLHLKNYRRPDLQRMTLRIMLMVPIYAIASYVSLSSRYLSDYIDMVRDLYEAFVIYTFFTLLVNYMGGERDLLIILEDRPRTHHIWPINLLLPAVDMSDPHTFLNIRRGVLQFALVKPVLSFLTVMFKFGGAFHEGYVALDSAYLWISLSYNLSVCCSMYCLVIFYLQCSRDLRAYRPFPKFVCVKAIIFFSFWQGLALSFFVWAGVIKGKEEKYSANNIATALQDLLILLEIVPLAFLHWHAFPWEDYDDSRLSSRIALPHAIRDVFGIKDIVQDYYHIIRGTTFHFAEEQNARRRKVHQNRNQMMGSSPYASPPTSYQTDGQPLLEEEEEEEDHFDRIVEGREENAWTISGGGGTGPRFKKNVPNFPKRFGGLGTSASLVDGACGVWRC